MYIYVYDNDSCSGSADASRTFTGAVTVLGSERNTVSATLNGASSVTVVPSASIAVVVTGIISGGYNGDWDGTESRVSTSAPGSMTCTNTSDRDNSGTYTSSFSITAPATPGVYNAYFRINGSDSCSGSQQGTLLTMTGAITVEEEEPPAPEQGTLTVNKVVIGGPLAVSDFPLTVTQGEDDPVSVTSGEANLFDIGTYTVGEVYSNEEGNPYDDYTATFSGACDDEPTVTIALDDNLTCTITNTYTGPETGTLRVYKNVSGEAEGLNMPADFSMHVWTTGEEPIEVEGSPQAGSSDSGSTFNLTAGNYQVTETGPSGYSTSYSEGCEDGLITVSLYQTVTCTVTNSWDLIISEVVENGFSLTTIGVAWTTNHPATSRLVYDTVSHDGSESSFCPAPNDTLECYGYAYSTDEDSTLTIGHNMVITGLEPNTTYYIRPVSHGSPQVIGAQIVVTTSQGSSGGGGGGPAPAVPPTPTPTTPPTTPPVTPPTTPTTTPVGQVLGDSTNTPSNAGTNNTGKVLGDTTQLPRTGAPVSSYLFVFFAILAVIVLPKLTTEALDQ